MKPTDALMFVAIVAVALACINLIITINKIGDFKALTGFMLDTATANLTIQSNIQVNFTTDNLDWGTGYVSTGEDTAELNTKLGEMNGTGWNNISRGLILKNIGSSDCQFNLTTTKNATEFIGGGVGGGPFFQWNITDINSVNVSEPNGCAMTVRNITNWANATTQVTSACDNFTFRDTEDELTLDLRIVIPNDAVAEAKGVTITATADVVI